jgi:hypothetical protein
MDGSAVEGAWNIDLSDYLSAGKIMLARRLVDETKSFARMES